MLQVTLASVSLQDARKDADPADASTTSYLSGCTLINSSSWGSTDLDPILLQSAEESEKEADEQHCPFSPSIYYDDLDIEEMGYEYQRLIEAAEMEDMASQTKNRGMSPTGYFESSSPPLERGKASLRSSPSSLESPFSPSRLSLSSNEIFRRPKDVVYTRTLQQLHIGAELHHPFVDSPTESDITRPPCNSPSRSSNPVGEDQDRQNVASAPDVVQRPVSTEANSLASGYSTHPPKQGDAHSSALDRRTGSAESLRRRKRGQDSFALTGDQGKVKRLRFTQDVYDIPVSPEPSDSPRPTFSTATTAVNSEPGSPNQSVPIDYTRVMQIIMSVGGMPVKYICHEHQLLQISGFVQEYRNKHPDELITLRPQDMVRGIKAATIHYFIHWLYSNYFMEPKRDECSFRDLLDLYFLAHAYAITVLKNVVIDHLIDKSSGFEIPAYQTKRIYKYTGTGDQLRRLWVDIYVWEVTKEQFRDELNSGKLDPTFLQELALAQMQRIRAMQKRFGRSIPPYEKSKSAYHRRDDGTGVCCRRKQYEGEGYYHRDDYDQENANLKDKLEKLHSKLEALKLEESENTSLKRQLHKVQLRLNKAEMKVMAHVSIDHKRLWRTGNLDNPEIAHPELLRKKNDANGLRGKGHPRW